MLESLRSPQLRHGPNFPMQVPQDFGGNYQEHALPKASRRLVAAGQGLMLQNQEFSGHQVDQRYQHHQYPQTTRASNLANKPAKGNIRRVNQYGMDAGQFLMKA